MYNYQKERAWIFTEEGQVMFLEIRDKVKELLRVAGAFRIGAAHAGVTGDSWHMIACVDRLVELGEIVECTHPNINIGQNRIFTDKGYNPY